MANFMIACVTSASIRFLTPVCAGRFPSAPIRRACVQFLETIQAIARIAHYFASIENTAKHIGKVQQTHFILDNLLLCVH
jgi:hypothetical protein